MSNVKPKTEVWECANQVRFNNTGGKDINPELLKIGIHFYTSSLVGNQLINHDVFSPGLTWLFHQPSCFYSELWLPLHHELEVSSNGGTPKIIRLNRIFHERNHAASLGYLRSRKSPHLCINHYQPLLTTINHYYNHHWPLLTITNHWSIPAIPSHSLFPSVRCLRSQWTSAAAPALEFRGSHVSHPEFPVAQNHGISGSWDARCSPSWMRPSQFTSSFGV